MQRRDFFKKSLVVAGAAAVASSLEAASQPLDGQKMSKVAFPQKRPMITYSDRPPLLETPREVFSQVITPNDHFFVRWHMPEIPTFVDLNTYRLRVNGLVDNELEFTLDQLKTEFEPVEVTSVLQCGGNGRSSFSPIAGGIQWGNGAIGNATWKGARLKDILDRAGLKIKDYWISFYGLDKAAYYKTPNFIREMHMEELGDHVIVAYEMNGEELPYLNGYPVRLIIPGYYSDSWVKMLSNLTITEKYQELFFMDVAYRIPDNATESEEPGSHKKIKTKPITTMNVKSMIGYPTNDTKVYYNSHTTVRGVAFDQGKGIKEVQVSVDGGKTWEASILDDGKLGRYSFRAFRYTFKPGTYGKVKIMSKAINLAGEVQPLAEEIQWNHGGYKYNGIDTVTIEVV
ncbi:molybdopterin-dependent oxidoreductase [Sulfurimonas sp. MAG313]|nr:molybdopterin-dependent oxidoreductase [Sulfurimonas sp. MAG313]MDF1880997.1 molybdopterin-dependent oxidoreductase [Sulfurimonas sp. MAG313]